MNQSKAVATALERNIAPSSTIEEEIYPGYETDYMSRSSRLDIESPRRVLLENQQNVNSGSRRSRSSCKKWIYQTLQPVNCRLPSIAPSFLILIGILLLSCIIGSIINAKILIFLIVVSAWLISLALHEFGHAFVAYYSGDSSVADKGYLSLDILKYTDPIMTFLIPTLLILSGGVALPGGSVLVTTSSINSRWKLTAVSLAGPLANFAVAIFLSLVLNLYILLAGIQRVVGVAVGPSLALSIYFQVMASVLNMLPLPPLDGWGCLAPWLRRNCFLVQWLQNPWRYKTISLITLLATFLLVRNIPAFKHLIDLICVSVLRTNASLLQAGLILLFDLFHL